MLFYFLFRSSFSGDVMSHPCSFTFFTALPSSFCLQVPCNISCDLAPVPQTFTTFTINFNRFQRSRNRKSTHAVAGLPQLPTFYVGCKAGMHDWHCAIRNRLCKPCCPDVQAVHKTTSTMCRHLKLSRSVTRSSTTTQNIRVVVVPFETTMQRLRKY